MDRYEARPPLGIPHRMTDKLSRFTAGETVRVLLR